MKSGRQRRVEIKAHRTGKRSAVRIEEASAKAKQAERERAALLKMHVGVNVESLAPTGSYGTPDFVERGFYVDKPFVCKDCGKHEVWSEGQQKWWYEIAKGDVWTTATRCLACRRKERERRNEARRVHLEGLAKKQENKA